MGGAAMTDAGLACHATDCLGRYLPGRRDPGPDATASRRDASGPPVDYFGDHGSITLWKLRLRRYILCGKCMLLKLLPLDWWIY